MAGTEGVARPARATGHAFASRAGDGLDLERTHAKFRLATQLAALASNGRSGVPVRREGPTLRLRCEALRIWRGAGGDPGTALATRCDATVRRLARRLAW